MPKALETNSWHPPISAFAPEKDRETRSSDKRHEQSRSSSALSRGRPDPHCAPPLQVYAGLRQPDFNAPPELEGNPMTQATIRGVVHRGVAEVRERVPVGQSEKEQRKMSDWKI